MQQILSKFSAIIFYIWLNIKINFCSRNEKNNCITSNDDSELLASLKTSILKKAAIYEKSLKDKNFKEYKGGAGKVKD